MVRRHHRRGWNRNDEGPLHASARFYTLRRLQYSASRIDRYAAELERLQGERAQLRETIAQFWTLIGRTDAQRGATSHGSRACSLSSLTTLRSRENHHA